MTRDAPAIAAAEQRVAQARHELRNALHSLRRSLSLPSSLAAAFVVGALLGRLRLGTLVPLVISARRAYGWMACSARRPASARSS